MQNTRKHAQTTAKRIFTEKEEKKTQTHKESIVEKEKNCEYFQTASVYAPSNSVEKKDVKILLLASHNEENNQKRVFVFFNRLYPADA